MIIHLWYCVLSGVKVQCSYVYFDLTEKWPIRCALQLKSLCICRPWQPAVLVKLWMTYCSEAVRNKDSGVVLIMCMRRIFDCICTSADRTSECVCVWCLSVHHAMDIIYISWIHIYAWPHNCCSAIAQTARVGCHTANAGNVRTHSVQQNGNDKDCLMRVDCFKLASFSM